MTSDLKTRAVGGSGAPFCSLAFSMNQEQLQAISHIIWAAENLGKEAAKVNKQIRQDVKANTLTALEVSLPEWFDEAEYQVMGGDAGKANSDYFRVYYKTADARHREVVEIVIVCPTFLRGHLRVTVTNDGHCHGSY